MTDTNLSTDVPTQPIQALHSAPMLRWFTASAALTVPQATAPVAFSLVALSILGDARLGAAMVLAMTLAQVVGAIPITRLGRGKPIASFLRVLVFLRSAALAGIVLGLYAGAPFAVIIALSALAGLVNGATYGYLRALLNTLTSASRMPRALGIAATLNEVTFVMGPLLASGLGTVSPALAVAAMAVLGGLPALVISGDASMPAAPETHTTGRLVTPEILLWLTCAAAGGATIAAIEIGAVALALQFGFDPAMAILFTVPLCVASVLGGIWISIRNRASSPRAVVVQLALFSLGIGMTALSGALVPTILGAVLAGLMLAPLGTHYALVLDALAPPHRRAELFALLRTANAGGVIVTSALLTLLPLNIALAAVAACMLVTTGLVALRTVRRGAR
ncbi:MFS transporter [Alloyangia pacifica]|uniref:MFS transporter n=1 Tax=Alloyangia pacifica TaxID=311180 RepID=UPI0031E1027E